MNQKHSCTKLYVACPICDSKGHSVFFELADLPVNVCVQWSTRETALQCPKGNIKLAFCRTCGFIWNLAFDATRLDYTQNYENSLFFSLLFREYTNTLVKRLIDRYNIRDKDVIDIGCGKGDFLFLLCELGNNRGVGFDTSYESSGQENKTSDRVKVIKDFYAEKYAEYKADLICSRFVFEHIEYPKVFLKMLRNAIGNCPHVIVYFEVPNVSLILRELSVWDIIYEHCSYFSLNSFKRVFTLCEFEVLDIYESYKGQFIGIEARPCNRQNKPAAPSSDKLQKMAKEVDRFIDKHHNQLESWQKRLESLEVTGKRAVLWGAGAKGVSFLNMLNIKDQIQYVVDINPHKHGKYIPGTGQQIVSPEFLQTYQPDYVILTNPIYKDEIIKTVKSLGINPAFM